MDFEKLKKFAPILLRLGVSLVFLWFGINQLLDPESFFGYIPDWIYPHDYGMVHEHSLQGIHNLPLTPHVIVMGNGTFETVFGVMLIFGIFTRVSALLLSIHLFLISLGLGYNDLMIRDVGLTIATFAVFLHGPDKWCYESRYRPKSS
jgi:uncharacterized membrane protein YphA (DoxX/SURF4 family)